VVEPQRAGEEERARQDQQAGQDQHAGEDQPAEAPERAGNPYARGRARDEARRAALRPLAPGERPPAVTAAGAVALVLGATNLISFLAGARIGGERPAPAGIAIFTALMLVAAYGCFRVRYWAVLGMQALLCLIILTFSLLLIRAEGVVALLIAIAIIAAAGALFWFLVKSMARIQAPERPSDPD
jgi:hypothetical protein